MRILAITCSMTVALLGAMTVFSPVAQGKSQPQDAAVEELKSEMTATPGAAVRPMADAPAAPADAIEELTPDPKPAAEAPKAAAPAPAIEELAPEAAPAPAAETPKVATPAPAEVAKPADAIEELAPETKPAAEPKKEEATPPAEPKKEAAAAPALIEELTPEVKPVAEPKKADVPEAPAVAPAVEPAPAAPAAPEVAPAAPEVAPAPATETPAAVAAPKKELPFGEAVPDAETKAALEAAIKTWGSNERLATATQVAQQEDVRRKARELDGRKAMEAGDKAWRANNYAEALSQYRTATTKLPNTASCAVLRNRAAQRMPECELQIVRALVKAGKDADAITQGKEFLATHKDNPKLVALLAVLETPKPVPGGGGDVRFGDETEVQKNMRLGRENMVARSYARSREYFETVLGLDPDNREAMRYLKVLGELEYNNKTAERDATVKKMNAEVRDAWNPKYKIIKGKTPAEKTAAAKPDTVIEDKMKKIIIDEIEFRQANMHDVVAFLNKAARENDKTTEDESKRGVNIILNLAPGAPGAAAPAEEKPKTDKADDVFGAPAKEGGETTGGTVPEVTIAARFISLYDALKIICNLKGLKWKIDGSFVMIVPVDWSSETLETRMYPVEPTFIERVKNASSEMPAITRVGGREKEALDAGGGGAGGEVPSDLKSYFSNMGVKFPTGSSITYNSAIGKVIVANTADNLLAFEKLLQELNVLPQQVEIEARFVEVNETDLYEAGLEWMLTDNWEMLMKGGGSPYAPIKTNPRIQMNANANEGGMSRGLRFMGKDANGKASPISGGSGTMGTVASFASVLTNPDLSVILHALEQNGNADLLSAPKVTTRSGAEASIKIVTEFIYPTQFEVQGGQIGMNNNGNQNSASIVQETTVLPQDFATREVGVILNVLPEVSPDGNIINLTMRPQVVTEPIWYQYGSTVRRADGSEFQLNMPQPFFQVRQLETQISIYDGATVVMGGLITESVVRTNDKIPVLGDLPFIGVFFRSKSEESVKKNLLIFVTAKLVDPAGQLIRRQVDQPGTGPEKPSVPAAAMTAPSR